MTLKKTPRGKSCKFALNTFQSSNILHIIGGPNHTSVIENGAYPATIERLETQGITDKMRQTGNKAQSTVSFACDKVDMVFERKLFIQPDAKIFDGSYTIDRNISQRVVPKYLTGGPTKRDDVAF
uniref:Uncharacterized protein n=1 Tax=Anopheles gambiae TaxID=7165 RepID=A0A0E4G8L6_ANOGA